jgi:hypothetical protein
MTYTGVNNEWLKQHDKEVRDKVLDVIEKIIREYWETPYSDHPPDIPDILEKITELRSKQAGEL